MGLTFKDTRSPPPVPSPVIGMTFEGTITITNTTLVPTVMSNGGITYSTAVEKWEEIVGVVIAINGVVVPNIWTHPAVNTARLNAIAAGEPDPFRKLALTIIGGIPPPIPLPVTPASS
jgi:hypothetical protein